MSTGNIMESSYLVQFGMNGQSVKELWLEELNCFIEEKSNYDLYSGVVLISKNGIPLFEYASGLANKGKRIANSINTKFNLGSATKMFTGVSIAQLADQGLLLFTDKVGKYLPDYPNQAVREQVTIHQLLTHTSGLGSFIDLQYRALFLAERNKLKTMNDVIKLFKDRPLPYPIGEVHYSPDGFEVLGAIIEAVSGQNYYDYVAEHIYKVTGMNNSDSQEIDPLNPPIDIAIGYTNREAQNDRLLLGEKVDNLSVNFLKGTASGASYSTATDMLKFIEALLHHKLLSSEMTYKVLTPYINEGTKGNQTKYEGYGFQIFDVDGVRRIGHPGRFAGVNTRIDAYPDLDYTVIVLANYDPPAAFDVAERAGEFIVASTI